MNVNCPNCTANSLCTARCAQTVDCLTCGRRKQPIGRSMPLEASGSYCPMDCPGYRDDPYPPHLWPSEWAEHAEGHPSDRDAS